MNYCISLFLILVEVAFSVQETDFNKIITNTTSGHSFHENILCRSCGNDITFSSSLITKISPFSEQSYHDSLFSKDEVLIQVFMRDFFLPYHMITTNKSNCVGITEWEEADSWYPGYRWKPCVCSKCGTLVGWVFEHMNSTIVVQPDTFFSHILATLIGESCKYKNTLNSSKFPGSTESVKSLNMTTAEILSSEDKEFLMKCEDEFKDRYTEKDEEFMKVHTAEPSTPPIVEVWWVPQNSGHRNDRRFNRRNHPYDRHNRDSDRSSGQHYNEYENDRGQGYRNRPRFN